MKAELGMTRRVWFGAAVGAGAAVVSAPRAMGQNPSFGDPMAGAPEALRKFINQFRETVRSGADSRALFDGADIAGSEFVFSMLMMGPRRPMDELGLTLVRPTRWVLPNSKVAIVEMHSARLGPLGGQESDLWIALELRGAEWKPVCLRATQPAGVGFQLSTVPILNLQAAN